MNVSATTACTRKDGQDATHEDMTSLSFLKRQVWSKMRGGITLLSGFVKTE